MKITAARIAAGAVIVCALFPHAADAQVATSIGRTSWAVSTNYLGIENFECDCTLNIGSKGPRNFRFRSAPVVLGVRRGGPSDGILERGDVIEVQVLNSGTSSLLANRITVVRDVNYR